MVGLPDISLGPRRDEEPAATAAGVHVSDDAPTVPVRVSPDQVSSGLGPEGVGPSQPDPKQVSADLGSPDLDAAGPDPGRTAPGTEVAKTTDLPGGDLAGHRMSATEQGLVAVRHWAVQATDGAREIASAPGTVFTAAPPSFADYRAYVASRAWVPDGYEKGWLIWLPLAYYNTIGNAGVLTGYAVAWLTNRMLHFVVAVTVAALSLGLLLIFG